MIYLFVSSTTIHVLLETFQLQRLHLHYHVIATPLILLLKTNTLDWPVNSYMKEFFVFVRNTLQLGKFSKKHTSTQNLKTIKLPSKFILYPALYAPKRNTRTNLDRLELCKLFQTLHTI